MIIEYKGLTSTEKLIDTIKMFDMTGTSKEEIKDTIIPRLERCMEVWCDKELAGYFLIFNHNGIRSFDGYKFIKGHTLGVVKLCQKFLEDYPDIKIGHHASRTHVNRLAKLLGFREFYQENNLVGLERKCS